ncbi:MAG: M15 family metallopeptidase [Desulfobacterales bacterium]|nr:M15 family metallopeptidase [Desulfobacterales bacterium]
MKRRDFLKTVAAGFIAGGLTPAGALAEISKMYSPAFPENCDYYVRDYLQKIQYFDKPHKGDVYLDHKRYALLGSSVKRFKRLQKTVGHANFHLLNFDNAISFGRDYSRVGPFTKAELYFLEMIFYDDPALYGFFGEKPVKNLTSRIQRRDVVKVRHTGNYLYKGLPLDTYKKIKRDVGDQVILTSGVRSVIKQFLLFLNKAYNNKGNLSLASRSLAPPGYSFHGVSDFDVGQVGFGIANFTERFVSTSVYRKLKDSGYLKLRYPRENVLGVRFEPWHIKVNSQA